MSKECKRCRKCNESIPNRIIVDGVSKCLNSRKFCLKCSPWGTYNRNSIDPGNSGNSGKKYRDYTPKRKEQILLSLYKRGLTRKRILIDSKDGKCQRCGYNKNWRALSFHHRDRTTKIFGLSINVLWCKPLELLLKEAEKCDLVCLNCHMEIEEQYNRENNKTIVERVNEKYGTNF